MTHGTDANLRACGLAKNGKEVGSQPSGLVQRATGLTQANLPDLVSPQGRALRQVCTALALALRGQGRRTHPR